MKTSLILFAVVAAPIAGHAAVLTLPGTALIGQSSSPTPLLGAAITTSQGTAAVSGNWSASAGGSVYLGAVAASVQLRSVTTVGPTSITFGTDQTSAGILDVGPLISLIAGPGALNSWNATYNATSQVVSGATYQLTFNLARTTSLLGALDPSVFNNFTITVGDSNTVYSSGGFGAQLLGITDLGNGSANVTLNFTTESTAFTGPVNIGFGATTLASTNLLNAVTGSDQTLYTISGLNLNQVPEPSSVAMLGGLVGMMALIRRRSR